MHGFSIEMGWTVALRFVPETRGSELELKLNSTQAPYAKPPILPLLVTLAGALLLIIKGPILSPLNNYPLMG